jgi:hypothetical protein
MGPLKNANFEPYEINSKPNSRKHLSPHNNRTIVGWKE